MYKAIRCTSTLTLAMSNTTTLFTVMIQHLTLVYYSH